MWGLYSLNLSKPGLVGQGVHSILNKFVFIASTSPEVYKTVIFVGKLIHTYVAYVDYKQATYSSTVIISLFFIYSTFSENLHAFVSVFVW